MAKLQQFKYQPKQRVCMDWVDRPQNYNQGLYGILQLLEGSHLDNFVLSTLGWVAFHSLTFQLKCLDFEYNQCKKLAPVLCNGPCPQALVDCASIILSIIQQNEYYFKLLFQFSTASIVRAFVRRNKEKPPQFQNNSVFILFLYCFGKILRSAPRPLVKYGPSDSRSPCSHHI